MARFYRSWDYTFGAITTLVAALGGVLNLISFTYFTTLKTRNGNSEFFKRLYMVITFLDFW